MQTKAPGVPPLAKKIFESFEGGIDEMMPCDVFMIPCYLLKHSKSLKAVEKSGVF